MLHIHVTYSDNYKLCIYSNNPKPTPIPNPTLIIIIQYFNA